MQSLVSFPGAAAAARLLPAVHSLAGLTGLSSSLHTLPAKPGVSPLAPPVLPSNIAPESSPVPSSSGRPAGPVQQILERLFSNNDDRGTLEVRPESQLRRQNL